MKTTLSVTQILAALCPDAAVNPEHVLAYSGNAHDRRVKMRADARLIRWAVKMHGFGTPRARGVEIALTMHGHKRPVTP